MLRRFALLGLVVALLGGAYFGGVFELLSRPEAVVDFLRAQGAWSYVLYVASFALLEPFFVPGLLFVIPATTLWPLWLAFLLSWAGSVGAGLVGFGFARFVARDWVEHRLPARLRAYDDRLAERGLATVILVRLTLFLFPPSHWALGLSRVKFGPFLLGTCIGFLPGMAALTYIGGGVVKWISGQSPTVRTIAIVLIISGFALLHHWRRGARARSSARAEFAVRGGKG